MMQGQEVLAKGRYRFPQPAGLINIGQYIVLRKGGKKLLLLRLVNERNERLSGLSLKLTQYDANGRELKTSRSDFTLDAAPNASFIPGGGIEVDEKCEDFKVSVLSAEYGRYTYSPEQGGVRVGFAADAGRAAFDPAAAKRKLGGKQRSVKARKFRFSAAIFLFALFLFAVIFAFTYLHLDRFKEKEVTFSQNGVEYTFLDGDKGEDGRLAVTGWHGYVENVSIPAAFEGYPVVEIAENAFAGNTALRSVEMESGAAIGNYAFAGCTNLTHFDFTDVETVGDGAFRGCTALTEVESPVLADVGREAFSGCVSLASVSVGTQMTEDAEGTESETVMLGADAFSGCTALRSVTVEKEIGYRQGIAVFSGSYGVETLRMVSSDGLGRLADLFGGDAQSMSLKTFSVQRMNYIPDSFFEGIGTLASVTVSELGNSAVGAFAFAECSSLQELDLGTAVTSAGEFAFSGTALSAFDGRQLSYIGSGAFSGSSALRVFELEGNTLLNEIPVDAFSGCSSLASITIPQTVVRIGSNAFAGCSALRNVAFARGSALTEIEGYAFDSCVSLLTMLLPASAELLGPGTFRGCTALSSVTLPDTLWEIADSLFENCSSLTGVALPDTVNAVGASAFSGCSRLSAVTLPADLFEIREYAFSGCSSLSSVTVPQNVQSIGFSAFSGCTALVSYTAPFVGGMLYGNSYLSYLFGSNDPLTGGSSVPSSLVQVTVTDADRIGAYAFYGCGEIEQVLFPQDLLVIEESAFGGCRSLRSVTLPASLTDIYGNAFAGCYHLFEVYNESPLSVVRGSGNYGGVARYALAVYVPGEEEIPKVSAGGYEFAQVEGEGWYITGYPNGYVTLPSSFSFGGQTVRSYILPAYFFSGDASVVGARISSAVTRISEYAFANCTQLRSVIIEGAQEEICFSAFAGCTALTDVSGLGNAGRIAEQAFYGCAALTSADFGGGTIEEIGSSAFAGCSSLTEVTGAGCVLRIGDSAFSGCSSLRNVSFDGGMLEEIGAYAFADCTSLSEVYGLGFARFIGERAFVGCSALQTLSFEEGMTEEIGAYAFADCTSLSEVYGLGFARVIGERAFAGCSALKGLSFEGGATEEIGAYAFADCASLSEVYGLGLVRIIGDNAFVNCYSLADADFSGGRLEEIGSYAFSGCTSLTSVVFADGVLDRIGDYAFAGCGSLTDAVGLGTVRRIGNSAFSNCSSLTNADFSGGMLEEIGEFAFAWCPSLVSAELDDPLHYIGSGAFMGCERLRLLVLPESLTQIGSGAFTDCYKLIEVCNYSPFTIERGSSDYGEAGRFAVVIHTSRGQTDRLQHGTADGIGYAYNADYFIITGGEDGVLRLDVPSVIRAAGANARTCVVAPYAFRNNNSLMSVSFGDAVDEVGESAFAYLYSLQEADLGDVSRIGMYAFAQCGSLMSLSFGTVGEIGEYAFEQCGSLTSLSFGTVGSIGAYAFAQCGSLTSLSFGTVGEIGEYAFVQCWSLENVAFGEAGTIGSYAFSDCGMLTDLSFGEVREIGDSAFFGCSQLGSLRLPEGLGSIGSNAFRNCSALRSVVLPASCGSIGGSAFRGCTQLYEVYNAGGLPLERGSTSYGYIAYYAYIIYDSADAESMLAEADPFMFVCYDGTWTLVRYDGSSGDRPLRLPETFEHHGETVSSYVLGENALSGYWTDALLIPSSVRDIDANAFNDFPNAVYYEGTRQQWQALAAGVAGAEYANVYVYADCVHEDGQWTYDRYGNVVDYVQAEWVVVREPTCDMDGMQEERCTVCGHVFATEQITHYGHYPDENGVCMNCGEEGLKIAAENLGTAEGIANDAEFPFAGTEEGWIVSTNTKDGTSATLTFEADGAVQLFLWYRVSCGAGDRLTVSLNGEPVLEDSGDGDWAENNYFELSDGDTLTVTYTKDEAGAEFDDCVYLWLTVFGVPAQ